MFISSYSTYVGTDVVNKSNNYRDDTLKNSPNSFSNELSKSSVLKPYINKDLPIDYISNYKSFNNQQKLHEQLQTQDELKVKKLTLLSSAKVAYEDNSKIFQLIRKPALTLSQPSKIDEKEPKELKEAKEKNLRHVMVNTYLSNDKYFQITAA